MPTPRIEHTRPVATIKDEKPWIKIVEPGKPLVS